ncbi:hypothetical protein IMSAGC016_01246 [Muribaculaceae bacterium]|nr:hypothetical protein IMSAGC016_01246 [Muribaculaceae bacterium]
MLRTDPSSYMPISMPGWKGILPMSIPNPIGTRRRGSKFFFMASHTKKQPTASITRFVNSQLWNPVNCQKFSTVLLMNWPNE